MTSFIQKKLPSAIGLPEIIVKERERLNLSLEQLSFKTEISVKYLTALEKGDYASLPGEAYISQFLKKIAKVFKLNEKSVLELYRHERSLQLSLPKISNFALPPKLTPGWLAPKNLRLGLMGIGLLVLVSYLSWEIINIFTPPKLTISSPFSQTVTANPVVEIIGQTEPESSVKIGQQPIVTEPDGSFKQTVDLTVGLNVFTISSSRKHTKPSAVTISVLRTQTTTQNIETETKTVSFKPR